MERELKLIIKVLAVILVAMLVIAAMIAVYNHVTTNNANDNNALPDGWIEPTPVPTQNNNNGGINLIPPTSATPGWVDAPEGYWGKQYSSYPVVDLRN